MFDVPGRTRYQRVPTSAEGSNNARLGTARVVAILAFGIAMFATGLWIGRMSDTDVAISRAWSVLHAPCRFTQIPCSDLG